MKHAKLIAAIKALAIDGMVIAGAGSLDYGLWLAWHPLGFIVGGLTLAAAGVFFGYDTQSMRRRA